MSDQIPKHRPSLLIEQVEQPDGTTRLEVHGRDCARTAEVHDAALRGEEPPHPHSPSAARCGPAKVTSDAYRAGWDAINWGGKRKEVGQA